MNLDQKTMKLQTLTVSVGNQQRGSTILLVLAMLTILLLLGVAFSFSTRLETQASSNYAQLAQARSSAVSGLPAALPLLLQASQGITTTLQNWNTAPQVLQKMLKANGNTTQVSAAEKAALRQAGVFVSQNKDGDIESAPQASFRIKDLSGQVNLNAVPDQAAMERVVAAVLPGSDTRTKSNVLMALRGENLKTAKKSVSEEDEPAKNLDPRDPSAVLLDNLDRLKYGASTGRAAFTDQEIEKLSQVITIFSQAPEIYNATDGTHLPRIPLDSVEPKLVYETLKKAFPNKKEELLLQFAANLADFSDEDSVPTILNQDGSVATTATETGASSSDLSGLNSDLASASRIMGVEMTPMISEVYPDAETSVGFDDDGQFVEISNPWNKTISLAGWTLRLQGGVTVALSATLPPNGYLIVTDNYNTPKTDSPPGVGSVVSLFGTTADNSQKQFMMYPALDLKDRNSKVSLYNAQGQLADEFTYGSSGNVDSKTSFQRKDPMVRGYVTAEATPMAPASGGVTNVESMATATTAWEEDGNTTLTKISQLFAISTGFAESNSVTGLSGSAGTVYAGQLADLTVPEQANANSDSQPTNLDLRLIDLFTATPRYGTSETSGTVSKEELADTDGKSAYNAFRRKLEIQRQRELQASQRTSRNSNKFDSALTTNTPVYSYGKLNLNTCNKYALLGLNLDSAVSGGSTAGIVEQFEGYRLTRSQSSVAPFGNISEFVKEFVPNISRSNLEVLDDITDQVSVGSSAFEITSSNRLSPEQQKALESKSSANGPRPATATAKWVISMDQVPYSVVNFTLIP